MSANPVFEYHPQEMEALVPYHLREGLKRYIEFGTPTGSGLRSIIGNAPVGAVVRCCDDATMMSLRDILVFLWNHAPTACHGSDQTVDAWTALGGIHGQGGTW